MMAEFLATVSPWGTCKRQGGDFGIAPEVAMDKLYGFETADEVAEFLQDQGIKAQRASATSCAISKWVSEVTGEFVTTGPTSMSVGNLCEYQAFYHTKAVSEFIVLFDNGFFPELSTPRSSEGKIQFELSEGRVKNEE